ncbi:DUF6377 domain-containing protein [Saccharicrinis sp. GN24d3]|uniref:DUF6377 domain-containing protein n=1 Tax=Saccharicrinis sp. GN24d3 TaxID=3458416 RepID=UPI0040352972
MGLYKELDSQILKEKHHDQTKEFRLDSLKFTLLDLRTKGKEWDKYLLYEEIANEYSTYVFDSAMHYYRKAIDLAYRMNHPKAIAQCQSGFGHLLVSVGYYKEAIDTLNKVNILKLQKEDLQDHFSYKVRAYYDLADYVNDGYYSPVYRVQAEAYVDSVLKHQVPNTVQPLITKGLRFLARWQPDSAAHYYAKAGKMPITLHEQAVIHSCLGYIDITENKIISGKEHLIRSAIVDIKTSTKEAMSLMVLARFLFEQGEVDRAYKYILKAKDDAAFFGSMQRKLQVAEIFPAIEGAKLLLEERKKEKAVRYIWVVSALVLVVFVFLLLVYRQLFNLRKIWMIIKQNNHELKLLNNQLNEANKIKERYIGHFFNTGSLFIHKLHDISVALNKVLVANNPQKLKTVLRNINPKKERDQLFHDFDEVFLKLFPTFINEVDNLVEPDRKYVLKPGQLLNTELRILALIRLGVEDNETMSQALGVSINTIYTYKTKAKNKSALSTDEFFKRLKGVKSV